MSQMLRQVKTYTQMYTVVIGGSENVVSAYRFHFYKKNETIYTALVTILKIGPFEVSSLRTIASKGTNGISVQVLRSGHQ
jgi:hypothetical protein